MSFLIYALLVLVPLLAAGQSAVGMRLQIEALDDKLAVTLVNDSDARQVIYKDFVIEPLVGGLALVIKDNELAVPLTVIPRVYPPDHESYVKLWPGQFVGHYITFAEIKGLYGLKKGCYEVQAIYEYKWGTNDQAVIGPIKSNMVSICWPPPSP